jgi:hypothetical protein
MAGNTVTLTFAGDTQNVESSFDRVGSAARDMDSKVRESGGGFSKASEGFDTMDTRAMGFRDTLTGLQDGAKGVKQAAAGDWGFETLLLIGFGVGDLASGFVNFLIPALKSAKIAQLGLNFAFLTSPITWIILGIMALIAVIVLIATKTDWFQRAWRNSWNFIKNAAGAAWNWIKDKAGSLWNWLKELPGKLKTAFAKVGDFLMAPFRAAFNGIARAWNSTVGGMGFSAPDWVPHFGGRSFRIPEMRTFHAGGIIPGVRGQAVPFMGLAGERVLGPASSASSGASGEWVRLDLGPAVLEMVRREVQKRGGQASQLGVRVVGGTVRA